MHDPDNAMRVIAWVWLGFMGVLVVWGIVAYTLGTGERREANRRSIRNSLSGNGWLLLSLTLKYAGFAFPRAEHHLPWLWIPAFVLAVLTWSIKGLRWLIRWRKRTRPVDSTYTRTLRRASRRKL
jgi:hypothetical protein